ncbi:MAG: IS110 family transposase [Pseudomonadota bacterium]
MNATTKTAVGVDVAKQVFQVHMVDQETGEVISKQIKRAKFLEFFSNRAPCLIGMEACGGSQHWARRLTAMGHEVKLMAGKKVKAFVCGNKNDVADARAIWLAVQQDSIRSVAIKTEEQQAVLALHRLRSQLVKFRTAQINGLRGLMGEYGEVMGVGRKQFDEGMVGALARLAERLPAALIDTLREQWSMLAKLDAQIQQIEHRLLAWMKQDQASKAIAAIPGVGILTATAAVATMGDPKAFRNGREFAAWLGLVPAQVGTGGKVRLLGISKRGDTYLRTLLIHGARAVLYHAKEPGKWVEELGKRRPSNVVIVALANKMARTIWAMLAHGRAYEPNHAK